jgi:hypothetical protein
MKPLFLLLALALLPACAVSKFSAPCEKNPIPILKDNIRQNWSVFPVDENTVIVRQSWPVHSGFSLGWSRMYIKAQWKDGELSGWTYFKNTSLGNFFIPQYVDLGGGYYGGALKGIMHRDFEEAMDGFNIVYKDVEFSHGHSKSEIRRAGPFRP